MGGLLDRPDLAMPYLHAANHVTIEGQARLITGAGVAADQDQRTPARADGREAGARNV
ncbi:hypothetical protein [Sphingomonas zeae]|jgi:hypothetical protein